MIAPSIPSSCQLCPTNCSVCTASVGAVCTVCFANSYLSSGNCIGTCPSGTYPVGSPTWQCQLCSDNYCAYCSAPLLTNKCIQCVTGYYLYSNKCFLSCGFSNISLFGWYTDNSTMTCKQCDSSCYTCSGSLPSNCLNCIGNFMLLNTHCVSNCGPGYINRVDLNQCLGPGQCPSLCESCSLTSQNCLSCLPNNVLINGLCYSSCLTGTYNIIKTGTCAKCSNTCFTCNGPNTGQCTSCTPPLVLTFGPTGYCVPSCPNSQYYDLTLQSCQACDPTCLTCFNGTMNDCISCDSNSNFVGTFYGSCTKVNLIPIGATGLALYNEKLGLLPIYEHIATWDIILGGICSLMLLIVSFSRHFDKVSNLNRAEMIDQLRLEKSLYQVYERHEYYEEKKPELILDDTEYQKMKGNTHYVTCTMIILINS